MHTVSVMANTLLFPPYVLCLEKEKGEILYAWYCTPWSRGNVVSVRHFFTHSSASFLPPGAQHTEHKAGGRKGAQRKRTVS